MPKPPRAPSLYCQASLTCKTQICLAAACLITENSGMKLSQIEWKKAYCFPFQQHQGWNNCGIRNPCETNRNKVFGESTGFFSERQHFWLGLQPAYQSVCEGGRLCCLWSQTRTLLISFFLMFSFIRSPQYKAPCNSGIAFLLTPPVPSREEDYPD